MTLSLLTNDILYDIIKSYYSYMISMIGDIISYSAVELITSFGLVGKV